MDSPLTALFERVPNTIFMPLGTNYEHTRRMYWALINDLYESLFGPDATHSEGGEAIRKDVLNRAREFLILNPEFTEDVETDPTINASGFVENLIDKGWLVPNRHGAREYLHMNQQVSGLLATLRQFSEDGPTDVGGEVQAIYATLKSVIEDPINNAVGYKQAAKMALGLFSKLSSTTIRARDILNQLNQEADLAGFLNSFFQNYIAEVYISDYKELKTSNHPLRHRWSILDIVESLQASDQWREALLKTYFKTERNTDRAQQIFDRDTQRLRKFADIDRYLRRLDESVATTIRRATAQIHYRLRSQDEIEPMIRHLITAIKDADDQGVPLMIEGTATRHLSDEVLREPAMPKRKPEPAAINSRPMTPRERAFKELLRLKDIARQIDPKRTQVYLHLMTQKGPVPSEKLVINEPNDLIIFFALLRASSLTQFPDLRQHMPAAMRGVLAQYELEKMPDEWMENEYVRAPRFVLKRTGGQ